MPALLHRLVGEYRLEQFLGAGGMGEVYRGVHQRLGRVVAVKVLTHADPNTTNAARFRNEARIQAGLQHDHIARLFEFMEIDGRPCLIMEYVEGPTVAERIAQSGALPAREALPLFRQVVEAVGYLHERGIIHRDLKPGNVKICPDGSVKLLDFGISKGAATPRLTRTGNVVGTLHFLAPEQVRGHPADPRSDVWALGVMLYEMVTGQIPFEATNVLDLYDRISKASFLPARVLNPAVPRKVEALIAGCLKKRPADRYASAKELQQALARAAGAAPFGGRTAVGEVAGRVAAGLGGAWQRSAVALRRLQAPWVIGAVAAVLAVVLMLAWPRADDLLQIIPVNTTDTLSVQIDLAEGRAEVYAPDGRILGHTPYRARAAAGAQLAFVLRREGYLDKPIKIDMNGRRSEYVFPMEKIED